MSGRGLRSYCLLAGAGDALTGMALLASPGTVLALLHLGPPAGEAIFLRFLGVFVAGVGGLYLYPLALREAAWRRRLRPLLEATTLLRGGVTAFLVAAVAAAALPSAWLTVAAFDGTLALLQAGWLLRGRLDA